MNVPQVSVVTNTRADSAASSRPIPARVMAAMQNASSACASILDAPTMLLLRALAIPFA